MKRLARRVAAVGTNTGRAMGSYHPVGTAATPHVEPLALVSVVESPGGYGDSDTRFYQPNDAFGDPAGGVSGVRYQDVTTMWGPNGEPIPATAPGSWGQLRRAGRL
jgi:hypothetical protein